MDRKGSAPIIVLIILIIILIAGVIWYFRLKQVSSSQQISALLETSTPTLITPSSSQQTSSTTTATTSTSTTLNDVTNFSIPALYSGDAWHFASTTFEDGGAVLSINYPNRDKKDFALTGQFYVASNTDPGIAAWQAMVSTTIENGGEPGFYGGDGNLLGYYDKALISGGYTEDSICLDQKFNVINSNSDPLCNNDNYSLSPIMANGPIGSDLGYIKYFNGRFRVVVIGSYASDISNHTGNNEVFVSNIFSIKDLTSSSQYVISYQ